MMSWIESVNHFWFSELRSDDWFSGDARIDALIRSRFAALFASLKQSPPLASELTVEGHVAAVIVFDQFSRNMFRERPDAFATDALALELSCHAVDLKLDRELPVDYRQFLYMPFMHSEDRSTQLRSVELFRSIESSGVMDYALRHKEIIDRFGRFPHRNAILGRVSTSAELEFLLDEGEK